MFKSAYLPASVAVAFALASAAPAAAQQTNLGGGLIEFLATGQTGGARYAPQPQRAATPGYYPSANGTSYHADPLVTPPARSSAPAAEPAIGYVQRIRPPAYQTSPETTPYGLIERAPSQPAPRVQAPQVAYAPMPRVQMMESRFEKQMVDYDGPHAAGTIVIDTPNKYLYLVQGGGKALRYGIGVGRPGFAWAGTKSIIRKAEWPSWTPPKEMLKRRPDLPRFMNGGEDNPLGARALYLGSSLYRIHGTNEPSTIGQAVSSGCIRMRNQDVIDLYDRVRVGTRVIVI